MKIPILTDKDIIIDTSIKFDVFGNLYFELDNFVLEDASTTNLLYQININGSNKLEAYAGKYDIIPDEINTPLLTQFKVKDPDIIEKEVEKKVIIGEEDHEDITDRIYYPEDIEYEEPDISDIIEESLIDDDNIKTYGNQNQRFIFSYNNVKDPTIEISVDTRDGGDIAALYDTYIYKNNQLYFKSMSPDRSIYRILIHNNGDMYFRLIGENDVKIIPLLKSNGLLVFNHNS